MTETRDFSFFGDSNLVTQEGELPTSEFRDGMPKLRAYGTCKEQKFVQPDQRALAQSPPQQLRLGGHVVAQGLAAKCP